MKNTFRTILIEMIPVILGILIALFINNWKEKQGDRAFLNKVMNSIGQEMEENKMELIEVFEKHAQLVDTIKAYFDDDNLSISDLLFQAGGLQSVVVKNTAWRSFLNSRIDLIDYKTISQLSEIESSKETLEFKLGKMIDFILSNVNNTSQESKQTLLIHVNNMIDSEMRLITLHEIYLDVKEKDRYFAE